VCTDPALRSLHDALPIFSVVVRNLYVGQGNITRIGNDDRVFDDLTFCAVCFAAIGRLGDRDRRRLYSRDFNIVLTGSQRIPVWRSEEHTSELQSPFALAR